MPAIVAISTFITVTLMIYGLLHRAADGGGMDVRLGGLHYARPAKDALPDPDAAFTQRVIRPIMQGLSRRANGVLPSSVSERLEKTMVQAGMKMKPGQFLLICGVTAGVLPILATLYMASMGQSFKMILGAFGVATAMGIYGPRVIEKVHGPFCEELTRTMREVQMGRARRDAFIDMADRTGVDELRQLINAVVQAEAMGISIGGVIRVQTGVIRTKRRQKAEEQAFKAPIKMVFPLVFFIFPAIMIVIGGPAIIQLKNNL